MKAIFKVLREWLEDSIRSNEELMRMSKDEVNSHSYGVLQGKIDLANELLYMIKNNLL